MSEYKQSTTATAQRRTVLWLLVVLVCLTAPLASGGELLPLLAFDAERSADYRPGPDLRLKEETVLLPVPMQTRPGFLRQHMLPRMAHQLRGLAPIHALEIERSAFEQSEMQAWISATVEARTLSGTKKALRDFLITETSISRVVESFRVGRHGFGRPANDQAFDFGVGASHGLPRFELRHRSATGTVRFNFALTGSSGLEFRPAGSSYTRFYAGYDALAAQYVLSYRCGF